MTALGWFLAGMVTLSVVSVTAMAVVDREFREALSQVALVAVVGPAALVVNLTRRGPRAQRISPAALMRFCRQVDADMRPAWLLSYGGRGVVFIRRRATSGWRNNIPNRANDAIVGASGRSRRAEPINVREASDDRTE